MPRKPRIHFRGALYHVIARGNNQESIFLKDKDKAKYLYLVNDYKKRYPFFLYAFALLDNHVHLLMEVIDTPLSRIMQGIQQSYTQYFNRKYHHSGHVFQQRYHATLCQKEEYLLALIRYIHFNPLEAGLSQGLDYRWSSHYWYRTGSKNRLVDVDVDIEYPLSFFSHAGKTPREGYLKFINAFLKDASGCVDKQDEGVEKLSDEFKPVKGVLGDDDFSSSLAHLEKINVSSRESCVNSGEGEGDVPGGKTSTFSLHSGLFRGEQAQVNQSADKPVAHHEQLKELKEQDKQEELKDWEWLSRLQECLQERTGISLQEMRQPQKKRVVCRSRMILIYLAGKHTRLPRREIAAYLRLTPSSISNVLRELPGKQEKDRELAKLIEQVKKDITDMHL